MRESRRAAGGRGAGGEVHSEKKEEEGEGGSFEWEEGRGSFLRNNLFASSTSASGEEKNAALRFGSIGAEIFSAKAHARIHIRQRREETGLTNHLLSLARWRKTRSLPPSALSSSSK